MRTWQGEGVRMGRGGEDVAGRRGEGGKRG